MCMCLSVRVCERVGERDERDHVYTCMLASQPASQYVIILLNIQNIVR